MMEEKLTKALMAICALLGVVVVVLSILDRPVPLEVTGTEYGDFTVVSQNGADASSSEAMPQRIDSIQAKVNINTATQEELMTLNGIGEKLSQRIIEERNFLPFESAEDILRVKGIGEKTFEKIKPYIVV